MFIFCLVISDFVYMEICILLGHIFFLDLSCMKAAIISTIKIAFFKTC